MKKSIYLLIPVCILIVSLFASCNKDEDNSIPPGAPLIIEFTHKAGPALFHLDSVYINENGDEFTATMFKYYISNIRLIRTDNTEYFIPNTYFLINQDIESTLSVELYNLSAGMFKGIRFILGVDSARNTSGIQTGELAPEKGMFWDWNTGYIFLKLEGTSPVIPTLDKTFTFHIGGFAAPAINYKEISLDFDGDILVLASDKLPELHLEADVLEILKTPVTIDLSTFPYNIALADSNSVIIANNYADMFRYDHLHN